MRGRLGDRLGDGRICGTPADPDAVQWVDYDHDQYGRLDQVASSDFPAPTVVAYTYHPESDWLHTTTFPNGLTATREPDPHRNLVCGGPIIKDH